MYNAIFFFYQNHIPRREKKYIVYDYFNKKAKLLVFFIKWKMLQFKWISIKINKIIYLVVQQKASKFTMKIKGL